MRLFLLFFVASARPQRRDRAARAKTRECENTSCADLAPELRMNCVNLCVSPACYAEIYASEPLEDGEIDAARARQFSSCVRREHIHQSRRNIIKKKQKNLDL